MIDLDTLIRYEEGELTEDETVEFFQGLVNDGSAWKLQGHYGRTAEHLIEIGKVRPPLEAAPPDA